MAVGMKSEVHVVEAGNVSNAEDKGNNSRAANAQKRKARRGSFGSACSWPDDEADDSNGDEDSEEAGVDRQVGAGFVEEVHGEMENNVDGPVEAGRSRTDVSELELELTHAEAVASLELLVAQVLLRLLLCSASDWCLVAVTR